MIQPQAHRRESPHLDQPPPTRTTAPPKRADEPNPQSLLGFRLPLLASIRTTTSARRYERMFGLKNLEGRTVFVLGANRMMSLKELVRAVGTEKAYASRTITALVTAGLVAKAVDDSDRRAVRLTLTPAGMKIYRAILKDSSARDEDWISVLTPEERTLLIEWLDRLTDRARRLAEAERAVS